MCHTPFVWNTAQASLRSICFVRIFFSPLTFAAACALLQPSWWWLMRAMGVRYPLRSLSASAQSSRRSLQSVPTALQHTALIQHSGEHMHLLGAPRVAKTLGRLEVRLVRLLIDCFCRATAGACCIRGIRLLQGTANS